MNDSEFLKNIQSIDEAVGDGNNYDNLSADELCKILNKIEGPLEKLLGMIEMLPVYGKTIVRSIRVLLAIARAACANTK